MSFFEKVYKDAYLSFESAKFPPNSLDPQVFYFDETGNDPILMPGIKQQILFDIEKINEADVPQTKARVWDYVITGPILEKDSSETCPIIVKVHIRDGNLDDATKERILQRIKEINDKKAVGTLHPIVYIPTVRKIDPKALNAAYHVFTGRWIKKPGFLEEKKDISFIGPKKKPKQCFGKGLRKLGKV